MPISDLCSNDIVAINKEASLQYAAQLMKDRHVGAIAVVDSQKTMKPVGLLTDRDIVVTVVAENRSLETPVSEVMSKELVQVKKSAGVSEVIRKMDHEGVRRMIITDESGRACGLVSSDDVLQLLANELGSLGHLVQKQAQEGSLRSSPRSQVYL